MKLERAPMGWNSWDCYGAAVTEEPVRKASQLEQKRRTTGAAKGSLGRNHKKDPIRIP